MEFLDREDRPGDGAVIKVFGVGGCGGNVVNTMVDMNLEKVAFVALNTDLQALRKMRGGECVQLGQQTTRGLGAGGRVDIAEQAAQEDGDRIRGLIEGTDMLFITAGMGGGTGTGAAPVVAQMARDLGVLTIAVVCRPFAFESRDKKANEGISKLAEHVNSLIVVSNERLKDVFGHDFNAANAFQESDKVLHGAVSGICDVIHKPGQINVDFADVRNVMSQSGMAVMGSGSDSGVDRASRAAHAAIECPLLDDHSLGGARGLLINISASTDTLRLSEFEEVQKVVKKDISEDAEVFFGAVYDDSLGEEMKVTVIATGLENPHVAHKEPSRPSSPPPPSPGPRAGGNGARGPRPIRVISSARNTVQSQGLDLGDTGEDPSKMPSFLRRQVS